MPDSSIHSIIECYIHHTPHILDPMHVLVVLQKRRRRLNLASTGLIDCPTIRCAFDSDLCCKLRVLD